jgi:hypothetical protein
VDKTDKKTQIWRAKMQNSALSELKSEEQRLNTLPLIKRVYGSVSMKKSEIAEEKTKKNYSFINWSSDFEKINRINCFDKPEIKTRQSIINKELFHHPRSSTSQNILSPENIILRIQIRDPRKHTHEKGHQIIDS